MNSQSAVTEQKVAEEEIKELEWKKSYLERSVKETKDNIQGCRWQEGHNRKPLRKLSLLTPPIPGKAKGQGEGKWPLFYLMDVLSA